MSVSLTGSRSPDDRRRRRLAVAGEGADAADLDAGGVALLRERLGDLPSASPWLPRQTWKRNLVLSGLWLGLILVVTALIRPLPPHPQIAPAVEHLTAGTRPVLEIYSEILLWTCAAQFAALIGWYRSHSQLDFQGRYRVWAWATAVLLAWGFFAGTSLHTAVATVAAPQLRWPIWRGETLVWLVPAALAGLSVWWMADRDLQRHRLGLWLVRSAALTLILSGLGELFAAEMASFPWSPAAQLICRCAGIGLLITGLWCHAWFVAYVNADPPESRTRTPIDWRGHLSSWSGRAWSMLGWLGALWPFRRRVVDTKPKRRVVKKKDEEDEEESPKRRRKPAAKKRAPAKSRTRTKPEPEYEEETEEAAEYEEESTDETWEEVDDSSAESEDEWTEEYEEEPAPPPVKAPVRTASAPAAKAAPPPPPAKPTPAKAQVEPEYAEEEDEDDGDDSNYRVDGGQSGTDQFKGLSKRQRRELKKQMKDQQRTNR